MCAAAQNARLQELSRQLLVRVDLGTPREPFTRQDDDRALPQHCEPVAAILASDAERAGALAREHPATTEDRVRAVLEEV